MRTPLSVFFPPVALRRRLSSFRRASVVFGASTPASASAGFGWSGPPVDEKLVRDGYDYLPHRVAEIGERYGLLAAKFDEEVAEVRAATIGTPAFIEELADLVEVCYALGGADRVEAARQAKRAVSAWTPVAADALMRDAADAKGID